MTLITFISANDLVQWADRRDAQEVLPRLLGRLASATLPKEDLSLLSFDADEAVQLGGLDGVTRASKGNAFVPAGNTVWEMGVGMDPKKKANSDYEKRTADDTIDHGNSTFAFATPRRWGGKDDWVKEKNAEGKWAEVRAYDADSLLTWLQSAAAVHTWLSQLVNPGLIGATDLESYWEAWCGATQPPLPTDLVLAGRGQAADSIGSWMESADNQLEVRAATRSEAVAVVAATVLRLDPRKKEYWLARTIVVDDPLTLRQLASQSLEPLTFILNFSDREILNSVPIRAHRLILPVDTGSPASSKTIVVKNLDLDSANAALSCFNRDASETFQLASLAAKSLNALRRKLAINPGSLTPKWAEATGARELVGPLLAGAWDDGNESDQAILANLSGRTYQELSDTLIRWSSAPDPPVQKIGRTWSIVAREDAWLLLGRVIATLDLKRFEACCDDVFSDLDSSLELPVEERWAASIYGKGTKHSDELRQGLAKGLLLMATLSDETGMQDSRTGQAWADTVVHKNLQTQAEDSKRWASLSPLLPLLAEASPSQFISAAEKALDSDLQPIRNLFGDQNTGWFSTSRHTSLLWALDALAWRSEYLALVAVLLSKLVAIDPGGNQGNRPIESLKGLFFPLWPSTLATVEERFGAIDVLRKQFPETSWPVLLSMLKTDGRVVASSYRPVMRAWSSESPPRITAAEWFEIATATINRLLEDADASAGRWINLISEAPALPDDACQRMTGSLASLDTSAWTSTEIRQLHEKLTAIISRHERFPDAGWSMTEARLATFKGLAEKFSPRTVFDEIHELFARNPEIVMEAASTWQEREEEVKRRRGELLGRCLSEVGLDALLANAETVSDPLALGFELAQIDLDVAAESGWLLRDLAARNGSRRVAATAYVRARSLQIGGNWAAPFYTDWIQPAKPEVRSSYLLGLLLDSTLINLLRQEDDETRDLFWVEAPPYGRGPGNELDHEYIVAGYLQAKNPLSALRFIATYSENGETRVPHAMVVQALEDIRKSEAIEPTAVASVSHDVQVAFGVLQGATDVEETVLASLEWQYLPLFDPYFNHKPRTLYRAISSSPQFFVELISLVYRAEGEEPSAELDEQSQNRATAAFRLLNEWDLAPGAQADGSIDGAALLAWVIEACRLAKECGRGKKVYPFLAKPLARTQSANDGFRLAEAVRDLIETVAFSELEDSILIEVHNARGTTSRGIRAGGDQERALADSFRAASKGMRITWPRTAGMMDRLALSYDDEARIWDERAEREMRLEN